MEYNVIYFNCNTKTFEPYNVMPYFVNCYREEKKKPKTSEELKQFIKAKSTYMYWSRCQYEMILQSWPTGIAEEKWDIHRQIMMNIDLFLEIFKKEIKFKE